MDIVTALRTAYELAELVDRGEADADDITRLEEIVDGCLDWRAHGGFVPANFDRVIQRARVALLGEAAF